MIVVCGALGEGCHHPDEADMIPDSGSFDLVSGGGNGKTSLYVFGFFACKRALQN